jgi:uncharacterized repeat protein (TIGR02543 family)
MKKLIGMLFALSLIVALTGCAPAAGSSAASFTVTFDSQGGGAVASQSVPSGQTVAEPTAPARDGYVFRGWYKEAACATAWTFATDTVSADVTLYAKWVDSSLAALAGTWTGLLKSTTYAAHHINLPLFVALTEDGKVTVSWDYAGEVETHSTTWSVTATGLSFSVTDKFESPTTEGKTIDATLSITSTLDSDGKTASGSYKIDYADASEPDEEGTIKISSAFSGLAGKWMGQWYSVDADGKITASDWVEVEFKADGTFSVTVDKGTTPFIGNWTTSGTVFNSTQTATTTIDGYTYSDGKFPATIKGNYLSGGSFSLTEDFGTVYKGTWSLGKEL